MKNTRLFIVLFFLFTFSFAGIVVKTKNKKIEILGLKSWSLKKLMIIYKGKFPEDELDKCAINFKILGFPDASIVHYLEKNSVYSVITLIEPEYSKFVSYRNSFSENLKPINEWKTAIKIYKNFPLEFQIGLKYFNINSKQLIQKIKSHYPNLNNKIIDSLWKFIRRKNKEKDKDLAVWVLKNDSNYINRIISSLILINFSESDPVWWILVDTLRDHDGRVSNTADSVLNFFISHKKRKINWYPVKNTLTLLFNGTNPFYFPTLLNVLKETKVSVETVLYMLKDTKGYLLLSYLSAEHYNEKQIARKFLKKVFNRDYGYDQKKWKSYIEKLLKEKGYFNF